MGKTADLIQLMYSFEANVSICQPEKVMTTEVKILFDHPNKMFIYPNFGLYHNLVSRLVYVSDT